MTVGVAVVTGSTGAIGSATCALLAANGYVVVGLDLNPSDITVTPGSWAHVTADLTRSEDVVAAFDHICSKYGVPSVLVNNAGVYHAYDFLETTVEQFDQVYAANVRSTFLCTQEFARRAPTGEKSVTNVASVSGQTGSPDAAYGASKGAVIALTKSMSLALAHRGIRVNAVAPGIVVSAMSARIPEERRTSYAAGILLGRFAAPEEIARVIAALATETGSYMTGTIVDVNGGLH